MHTIQLGNWILAPEVLTVLPHLGDLGTNELLMRLEMEIGRLDFDAARQTLMQLSGDLELTKD